MKINTTKRNTIWSYIGIALSMGANLILLPLILFFLDDNDVGLYYVFVSLSAIASLFDFGFAPSIARNMAYAWSGAKELAVTGSVDVGDKGSNYVLIVRIISACKIIYQALSAFVFVLGASIGTFYISSITNNYVGYNHFIAWGIYVVAITLNLLYSYYLVFLSGVGAVAEANESMVVARSIQIVLCAILLFCKVGIIGVAIAYLFYGVAFRLMAKRMFYKRVNINKELVKKETQNNKDEVRKIIKTIWPNTWREGLVTLSNYLLNQSTIIIASIYLSLKETGVYSVSVQLTTAVAVFARALFTSYQPTLQSAHANKDTETQKRSFSAILVSFVFVYIIGIIALLSIGRPLISLVKPTYKIDVGLLMCVGLFQFICTYRNCYCSFISTTNKVIYTRAFIVSSAICVVLSVTVMSCLKIGVYGLVAAQIISQLIYNVWKWPVYVHKQLNLSLKNVLNYGGKEIKRLFLSKQ